ncbi:uncharacterized protein N7529_001436 [Penicillium soppii]|uniref:uncharacterized protein n=1 Tax=Penicillium soppii TaxID=69789 RepID=UPI0025481047|nr:uncharacterized protein N7529_001436 [Penicillium soppii]KAJ5875852.1 hypothetical protein N7529_001436 [Penicillium soppii]
MWGSAGCDKKCSSRQIDHLNGQPRHYAVSKKLDVVRSEHSGWNGRYRVAYYYSLGRLAIRLTNNPAGLAGMQYTPGAAEGGGF